MPRKNSRDAAIVSALLRSQPWFAGWTLEPIQGLGQADVAKQLQKSLAFLAFGHPEGFGLPLAEAAACGCALIGYSGLGGRELLAMARSKGVGWEVEYGDWQGFLACDRGSDPRSAGAAPNRREPTPSPIRSSAAALFMARDG